MSEEWLKEALVHHNRLTSAVVTIFESVLKANRIDYLAITGRTKDFTSAQEKIRRKGYSDPVKQMTDLSGIRIVLFFESDVRKVSELMAKTFKVDKANSLNQDDLLSTNQTGYRSIHFVCDIGNTRDGLPEFDNLSGLQFEVQIRTVLQHAWAELSHDRSYKFGGKLPRELERRLYLYAGLLEIADKGFDELSKSIDDYAESIERKAEEGDLDSELNSITLRQFVRSWAEEEGLEIAIKEGDNSYSELLEELDQFGVKNIKDLRSIIPSKFAELAKNKDHSPTLYGLIRGWMLGNNWRKLQQEVKVNWVIRSSKVFLEALLGTEEYLEMMKHFEAPEARKTPRKRSVKKGRNKKPLS